jgi:hypothetical protein
MATTLFNSTAQGSGNNSSDLWIDLGIIPTGLRVWVGSWSVYSAKADSLYLYTNKTGKSAAIAADCTLLASFTTKAGASVTQDLYKKNTLHATTVYGTGTEHWWVRITSKSATLAAYNYKILYTTE